MDSSRMIHKLRYEQTGELFTHRWIQYFCNLGEVARRLAPHDAALLVSLPCKTTLPLALTTLGAVLEDLHHDFEKSHASYLQFLKSQPIGTILLRDNGRGKRQEKYVIEKPTSNGLRLKKVQRSKDRWTKKGTLDEWKVLTDEPEIHKYQLEEPDQAPESFQQQSTPYPYAELDGQQISETNARVESNRVIAVTSKSIQSTLKNVQVELLKNNSTLYAPLLKSLAIDQPWGRDQYTPIKTRLWSPSQCEDNPFPSTCKVAIIESATAASLCRSMSTCSSIIFHDRRGSENERFAHSTLYEKGLRYFSEGESWFRDVSQSLGDPPPGVEFQLAFVESAQ